ncbi:MAG TPA: hypothetical protein ENK28_03460 [Aliiroseovarius sp.]|nr:hypothetical protein [Aliiroseovarius sp.]
MKTTIAALAMAAALAACRMEAPKQSAGRAVYTDRLASVISLKPRGNATGVVICQPGPSRRIVWWDRATSWPDNMKKADADRACRMAAASQ